MTAADNQPEQVIDYEEMIMQRKKERARLEAIRESRLTLRRQLIQIYKHDCEQRKQFPAPNTEPIYDMVRHALFVAVIACLLDCLSA